MAAARGQQAVSFVPLLPQPLSPPSPSSRLPRRSSHCSAATPYAAALCSIRFFSFPPLNLTQPHLTHHHEALHLQLCLPRRHCAHCRFLTRLCPRWCRPNCHQGIVAHLYSTLTSNSLGPTLLLQDQWLPILHSRRRLPERCRRRLHRHSRSSGR